MKPVSSDELEAIIRCTLELERRLPCHLIDELKENLVEVEDWSSEE